MYFDGLGQSGQFLIAHFDNAFPLTCLLLAILLHVCKEPRVATPLFDGRPRVKQNDRRTLAERKNRAHASAWLSKSAAWQLLETVFFWNDLP